MILIAQRRFFLKTKRGKKKHASGSSTVGAVASEGELRDPPRWTRVCRVFRGVFPRPHQGRARHPSTTTPHRPPPLWRGGSEGEKAGGRAPSQGGRRCGLLYIAKAKRRALNETSSTPASLPTTRGSGTVAQARIHTPVSIDSCHPKRRRTTRATESLGRRSSFVNETRFEKRSSAVLVNAPRMDLAVQAGRRPSGRVVSQVSTRWGGSARQDRTRNYIQ